MAKRIFPCQSSDGKRPSGVMQKSSGCDFRSPTVKLRKIQNSGGRCFLFERRTPKLGRERTGATVNFAWQKVIQTTSSVQFYGFAIPIPVKNYLALLRVQR